MKFKKFALEYVFNCVMVAYYMNKERFMLIIRIALNNWSESDFKKLMNRLKNEGIVI